MKRTLLIMLTIGFVFAALATAHTIDPLPSWNEGVAKQASIQLVKEVSK